MIDEKKIILKIKGLRLEGVRAGNVIVDNTAAAVRPSRTLNSKSIFASLFGERLLCVDVDG